MRCFVAVEVDAESLKKLRRLLTSLPAVADVRWSRPEQLHLTLKFLGQVPDTLVPQLADELQQVSRACAPFRVRLTALGGFPTAARPRVLWCGVDDPAEGCRRWLSRAEPMLEVLGYPREQRSFTPHITLGRSRSATGSHGLAGVLRSAPDLSGPFFEVTEVVLFESRLHPKGARYLPVSRAVLGG
jgi:2'-5' RNA ligase